MSSAEVYKSIINLYRFNVQLTDDAVRLLDALVSAFDKTFIQVNSIQELEAKLRAIFPGPTSEKLISLLYNVARGYISQENTLIEAKKITVQYILILILKALNGKGLVDGYDIAMTILNDPLLRVLQPALPRFPYGKVQNDIIQPIFSGTVTILPGFVKGTDDYLAVITENFRNVTPAQLNKFGAQFGIQDAATDFYTKFRTMIIQRGLDLGKPVIGFLDLVDILSTFKKR